MGATLSSTATVASQVAVFPLPSLAVTVTVFGPKSLQSNAVWLRVKVTGPQLSEELATTDAGVIEAFPFASS
jgi:hypothetical protein